VVAWR